jgi:excinuclease ABC subunit C
VRQLTSLANVLPQNASIDIKDQAFAAPFEPGCYIMRDAAGGIIYIGKAKSLRNRLRSYFSGVKDVKTATLMRHAACIETIIVSNEYEALLLENTLIKQHNPKYNINLKDGKSYPVIRVSTGAFPRIFKTRQIIEDGSSYYGPFPNVHAVDHLLDVLKKIYPLRKCKTLRKRAAPCMYYHIKQCAAPCCGKISDAIYQEYIEKITGFLRGETAPLVIELTERMHKAAKELSFEKAAQFRNAITAINELNTVNSVVDFDEDSRDYIAFASEGVLITWTVFSMRGGKLTGRELYRTKNAAEEHDSLETFLMVFYTQDHPPPHKIYVQKSEIAAGFTSIKQYFKEQFNFVPKISTPQEKRHIAALAMARQNALEDLRKRVKERGMGPVLDALRQALGLKRRPERIEGFDIAQLNGRHPTASLITFLNGMPDKKNYRVFKLRTVVGKVDDFAAMREAVSRRYTRMLREDNPLPDLVLVDGGIGQVNAAKSVFEKLGIDIDLAGLAKRDEEIWLPGAPGAAAEPLRLPRSSEALKLLQAVRDETHRVATTLNQKLRSKGLSLRALESIDGIGPVRAQSILRAFGSLQRIAVGAVEEIAAAGGIKPDLAALVKAAVQLEIENRRQETAAFADTEKR